MCRRSRKPASTSRRCRRSAAWSRRRESPRENVAYWEGVFSKLSQTESWKKYVADNQFENAYQGAAGLTKFYEEFTGQMRGILQEAGVKTVR